MEACAVRALWILSSRTGEVCFSRRFPAVERQWRLLQCACDEVVGGKSNDGVASRTQEKQGYDAGQSSESESLDAQGKAAGHGGPASKISPNSHEPAVQTASQGRTQAEHSGSSPQEADAGPAKMPPHGHLPFDAEIARCFRGHQEAMHATQGLRKLETKPGTDAWLDDPVTQHVVGLSTSNGLLWPIVKHHHGAFVILVLPLVDPFLTENYKALQSQGDDDLSDASKVRDLSTLILLTPAITMALSVASAIGNVLAPPAELPPSTAPSAASLYSFGLMDSLTGFAKGGVQKGGAAQSAKVEPTSAASGVLKKEDKDALRTFIAGAMPTGQPLDLNPSLAATVASNGFGAADVPPPDQKQPFWKPYLYRGKQRLILLVRERVSAALFDRQGIEDSISISGEVLCRADLEGLPDVTVPLSFPKGGAVRALSVHPSAQAPETTQNGATLYLCPPLGLFTVARYQSPGRCEKAPIRGFFQLQMLSDTKAAVLIRLSLMEGLEKESSLEQCTLTIPFPGRSIASVEGTPSVGSLSTHEGSLEWRVVTPGRWFGGKTGEANLLATVLLAVGKGEPGAKEPERGAMYYPLSDSDEGARASGRPATWADPFAWDEYSHARVSFRLSGCSLSEAAVDTAGVIIYPPAKAAVEATYEVVEGDYILWNSLGKSPPIYHVPILTSPPTL